MSGRSHRIKRRKDGSLAWVARCEDGRLGRRDVGWICLAWGAEMPIWWSQPSGTGWGKTIKQSQDIQDMWRDRRARHTHTLSLSLLLRYQHGEEMSRDFASQSNQGTFQVWRIWRNSKQWRYQYQYKKTWSEDVKCTFWWLRRCRTSCCSGSFPERK